MLNKHFKLFSSPLVSVKCLYILLQPLAGVMNFTSTNATLLNYVGLFLCKCKQLQCHRDILGMEYGNT